MCGCTSNSHCSSNQVCYSVDNKCYSSGLSQEQSCAADNGDDVDARCASGLCRSSDEKCGCTSDSHCSSSQGCFLNDNECTTPYYFFVAECDLAGQSNEGTSSRVSLEVKRDGIVVYSLDTMDSTSIANESGRCPGEMFYLEGGAPDELKIQIHGSDGLGVDYFALFDMNGVEIQRWGAAGGGGWCFSTDSREGCWASISGADYPSKGLRLYADGTTARHRFGTSSRCNQDEVCSSNDCKVGGGSCSSSKCCAP